jgi:hypothetical protein
VISIEAGIISHQSGFTGDSIPKPGSYPTHSQSQLEFSRTLDFAVIDHDAHFVIPICIRR